MEGKRVVAFLLARKKHMPQHITTFPFPTHTGAGALVGGALYSSGGPDACFQGSAAALIGAWALLCVAEAALAEDGDGEGAVGGGAVARTVLASSDE